MAGTRTHTCVFFDEDGWLEPVCGCGQRALLLLDEEGDGTLVLLDDDAVVASLGVAARFADDLAVSA